ncbi:phenazine biosynthesis protein PhzF family [Arthrobacter alpinus]|uniref:Phenazine biosynthesis protein PhzF family n=1 Tax=Arthrobacter alpinus TaxID=656366 RepID=A0A1H5LTM0_9MICC|nr:PhzF family phenazine biosynthesis protein [Arthrobacter alpinus]SEE80324.1 phenazine biosynthesis protein PhzF family [Arthrobacter alpinus]
MSDAVIPEVLHLAAFADGPGGGNLAGVVLDAMELSDEQMLEVARDVGYSETAFVTTALDAKRSASIRYFSPGAEVPFCGHATVATAVALAEKYGPGTFSLATQAGEIVLQTTPSEHGMTASFTSLEPSVTEIAPTVLTRLLDLLGLDAEQLHPGFPAKLAFAGNTHPMIVVRDRADLDSFTFDAQGLRTLMDEQGWAGTVTVMWVDKDGDHVPVSLEIESRNLFPVGNIREDPATGSAAASTGAYLRSIGAVRTPASLVIRQGRHVGRPCILHASVPAQGGITVTGTATQVA